MLSNFAAGKWQVDDTNQTDYPIIKLNVVSGQQSYPISVDSSSVGGQFTSDPNQIWDIARVELANANGKFSVLDPYDQTDEKDALQELAKTTGTPYRYDKLANGLFLDPTPNYNYTNGLIVYIQRSPLYFAITATTGTPGIPDVFHEYLAIYPAFRYCSAKLLKQAPNLFADVQRIESDISKFYLFRNRDEKPRLKVKVENCR